MITTSFSADGIAVVTLDRPAALNALSVAQLQALDDAITQIGGSDARGLVIVGAGEKAFCAGADITELIGRSLREEHASASLGQAVFERIRQLRILSVAVIHGYAFGGGLELALACTFRVATPAARMGLPEIKLGLIPGYGGTQRLPRLIGEGRALDMILSGRSVHAKEAERIGLVTFCTPRDQVLPKSLAIAAKLARGSQTAIRATKKSLNNWMRQAGPIFDNSLALEMLCFLGDDVQEGLAALRAKRAPDFPSAQLP